MADRQARSPTPFQGLTLAAPPRSLPEGAGAAREGSYLLGAACSMPLLAPRPHRQEGGSRPSPQTPPGQQPLNSSQLSREVAGPLKGARALPRPPPLPSPLSHPTLPRPARLLAEAHPPAPLTGYTRDIASADGAVQRSLRAAGGTRFRPAAGGTGGVAPAGG